MPSPGVGDGYLCRPTLLPAYRPIWRWAPVALGAWVLIGADEAVLLLLPDMLACFATAVQGREDSANDYKFAAASFSP